MKFRALLAFALVALWTALGVSAASAAPAYPPPTCSILGVSTENPLPGDTLTVTGSSFKPNAQVRLELHTKIYVLATVTTDASGAFSTEVTLPAGVTGNHLIVAIGGSTRLTGCPVNPSQALNIQGPAGQPNPGGGTTGNGGTAFTGVNVLLMLLAAAGLIATGLVLNQRGKRTRYARR